MGSNPVAALEPLFQDKNRLLKLLCAAKIIPLFTFYDSRQLQLHQSCSHVLTALVKNLRGSDCKYRESADKLRKSKILITCQKNTFGELSSKILLKPSGILLFSGNSEKRFCLIYYAIIRLKIKQIESACFKTVCNARKQF